MRGLMVAVVVMGVLIIAGTTTLVVVIAHRLSGAQTPHAAVQPAGATPATLTLNEPPGTHIAAVIPMQGRMALRLQGGGPDRVVVIDLRSDRPVARIGLAH